MERQKEDKSSTQNERAAGKQAAINAEAKANLSQADVATINLETALVTSTTVPHLKTTD